MAAVGRSANYIASIRSASSAGPRSIRVIPVLQLCYRLRMAVRRNRSISVPPELDAQIRAEADRDGLTYSAWLAAAARKELVVRAGLGALAEVEAELGAFTAEELADAAAWAERVVKRSRRTGTRSRDAA
jgi:hypothetical protein